MDNSSERADSSAPLPTSRQLSANSRLPAKRRGEIAEAAFLLKAASLGFSVAKPWGDSDRYDFILDNGRRTWRVQVKSAHTSSLHGYTLHACGKVKSRPYTAREIDFLVGYVVPDDVWYVFPISIFGSKRAAVTVFPSSRRRMSRFEIYRDAWCLMACPNDGPCRDELNVSPRCKHAAGLSGSGRNETACPK
jgi:hypothetical protein